MAPALVEYVSSAGKSSELDKLPGMGGIFNCVNLSLYHYAGNNPVKYMDLDGREEIPHEVQKIREEKIALQEELMVNENMGLFHMT